MINSRFVLFFELFSPCKETAESILAVYSTGEVIQYPVGIPQNLVCLPKLPSASNSVRTILAHPDYLPVCLAKLDLILIYQKIRIFLSGNKLMVYGCILNGIDSLGIFEITNERLILIFSDTMIAVSSACFSSEPNSVHLIPRSLPGIACTFSLQSSSKNNTNRAIPMIFFTGVYTHRMDHIIPAPSSSKFSFMTWSDDDYPVLGFFSLNSNDKTYSAEIITLSESFLLELPIISPKGNRLGFVAHQDNNSILNNWELKFKLFQQHSLTFPPGTVVYNVCWGQQSPRVSESLFAVTSNGVFELCDEHSRRICLDIYGFVYTLKTVFYYLDDKFQLYYCCDCDSLFEKYSSKYFFIPRYLRSSIKGQIEAVSGLHLYRCENCFGPLLHPRVCSDPDSVQHCYCSEKCQQKHFPTIIGKTELKS